jgi:hypothetical protein
MESCLMTVVCRSDLSTLARIVSVLHARRAPINDLRYASGPDRADLVAQVQTDDAVLLAAQLRRVVGVLSADVSRPAVVAVAS